MRKTGHGFAWKVKFWKRVAATYHMKKNYHSCKMLCHHITDEHRRKRAHALKVRGKFHGRLIGDWEIIYHALGMTPIYHTFNAVRVSTLAPEKRFTYLKAHWSPHARSSTLFGVPTSFFFHQCPFIAPCIKKKSCCRHKAMPLTCAGTTVAAGSSQRASLSFPTVNQIMVNSQCLRIGNYHGLEHSKQNSMACGRLRCACFRCWNSSDIHKQAVSHCLIQITQNMLTLSPVEAHHMHQYNSSFNSQTTKSTVT